MKRFHDRLLLGAACIIIAAGCSKSLHNGGEGSSGAVGEHLESNIIYNGRESLRISRTKVEGEYLYEPFATRYTYSYPRSFYLSVNYKF